MVQAMARSKSKQWSVALTVALMGCGSPAADENGDSGSETPAESDTDATDTNADTDTDTSTETGGPVDCGEAPSSTREVVDALTAAWNQSDDELRDCLLELAWADAGEYRDPEGSADGRGELAALIGERVAAADFELTSGVVQHHRIVHYRWANAGTTGMDFAELAPDGRLARLLRFVGEPVPGMQVPASYADYFQAWNEPDPELRATLLEAVSEDFVYTDPTADFVSRDALAAHLTGYLNAFPGTRIEITSDTASSGEMLRATWTILSGEDPLYSGVDFIALDGEQRVARIATFFYPLPALGQGGFARSDCQTCVELSTAMMPAPTQLCTAGSPSSVELWAALEACTCELSCAEPCGDNYCAGMTPTAACGACLSQPVLNLLACTDDFAACLADG